MKDHKIEVFDGNKAVLFRNWSNDDFRYSGADGSVKDENCRWDGQPYSFIAGETRYLPEGLAHHFAKHLTDRELLKQKKDVDDQLRPQLYAKCFVDAAPVVASDATMLKIELENNEEKAVDVAVRIEKPSNDAVKERMAKARAARSAKKAAEDSFAGA